jgi:hypothetical protein
VEIGTVGESKFLLAIENEALNGFVVVINVRVGDEPIDSVHLHGDFPVYRNLATSNCIAKLTVVNRCRGVR